MDYSRFNYVAQPEDKIDPADLIPKIGPYDKWATMWGYKPIPGAKTPDDEQPTLDKWAREQDEKPYLRFSTEGAAGSDPGDETEAVGDADAVRATTLGLKNLARVSDMLLKATTHEGRRSVDRAEEVYGRMVSQWTTEMNHVVRVVGGFDSQQKHIGQQGVAVHDGAEGEAGRGGAVPAEQRLHDADVHDPAGHPAAHPADGPRRSRAHGAELGAGEPAAERAARSHGRAGGARRLAGVRAAAVPRRSAQAGVWSELRSRPSRSTSIAATCSAPISTPSTRG